MCEREREREYVRVDGDREGATDVPGVLDSMRGHDGEGIVEEGLEGIGSSLGIRRQRRQPRLHLWPRPYVTPHQRLAERRSRVTCLKKSSVIVGSTSSPRHTHLYTWTRDPVDPAQGR